MNPRLEMALLVANGYDIEDVNKIMNRLGKMGKMMGNRTQVVYGRKGRWNCGYDGHLAMDRGLYAAESEEVPGDMLTPE